MPQYLTQLFSQFSDVAMLYILASFVVAVLIWVEAIYLTNNGGKMPSNRLFAIISLITSSWLIVSGLALYFLDFHGVMMSVPVVYGIYSVMGWIYGARLIDDVPDNPSDFVVPTKYLTYCKSFSLVFGMLCVGVLAGALG